MHNCKHLNNVMHSCGLASLTNSWCLVILAMLMSYCRTQRGFLPADVFSLKCREHYQENRARRFREASRQKTSCNEYNLKDLYWKQIKGFFLLKHSSIETDNPEKLYSHHPQRCSEQTGPSTLNNSIILWLSSVPLFGFN